MSRILLFTCEHGGNEIPHAYALLFKKMKKFLETHRGYDPGALELAKEISRSFCSQLIYSTTSRLLVDLNRSESNPSVFSEATHDIADEEKEKILQKYYRPYRKHVEAYVREVIAQKKKVLHISVHSFTGVLNSMVRKCDIGLLYDPKRSLEKKFCDQWHQLLADSPFKVRRNYPYKGTSDGLTTHLRSLYPQNLYMGIEIEVNQKYPTRLLQQWEELKNLIETTLRSLL